jgi:YHS domain-containing protein
MARSQIDSFAVRRLTGALALALVLTWSATAYAQQQGGKSEPAPPAAKDVKLPTCPVSGEAVDFTVKTMTADGPVYFCCPDCIKPFEAEPAKYAEKVAAQRAMLKKMERIQVTCPVMGEPIDGKTFATVGGEKIAFCCPNCVASYEKEPAKYKAKLEASYTYQTKCPVTGEKINPLRFVDLPAGQRIYLCCPACGPKLLKEPVKYAPQLAAQGIKIDVKKLEAGESKGEKPHP